MSAPNLKGMGFGDAVLVWLAIGFIVVFGGGAYAAVHIGSWMAGLPTPLGHPIDLIAGLVKGKVILPAQATVVVAVMAGLVLALAILVFWAWRKGASKRARVDKAARYLGRGKNLTAFSEKGARATANRLGVAGKPGIVVGKVVSTGQTFIQSWEDLSLDIWGPRTGKSTSRVMPAILEAPGAVVSTSNKRDVVDGTRGVRGATAPCGSLTRRRSPRKNWTGGGTRSPTSPTKRRPTSSPSTSQSAPASRVPSRTLTSTPKPRTSPPLLLLPRRRPWRPADYAGLFLGHRAG
ncbi:hypothetical protein ABC337_06460 [Arthrobacter sp. 1P04PC]|uniref:hypothetical protein n=1 Tax=unclassified Arthrobacter TaxID=235627 RepID=UPI0039A3C72C